LNPVKNWRVGLVGSLISVAAVWFLFTQVDHGQLIDAVRTANYLFVVPCVGLLLLGLVTRAMRWRVLLDDGLRLHRAFSIMNVAYLVNGVLPLRIGEVARIYLAYRAKPPVPIMKSTSTIITERLLDLMAVIVMALLSVAAAPLPDQIRNVAMVTGPLAVVGFSVLILLAAQRARTESLLDAVVRRLPILNQQKQQIGIKILAAQFLDGLAPLTQPSKLFAAIGLTTLSWGISAAAGHVLMFAFYEQASWATTLMYIAAAAFAIAVPAVPGNIGTYEAAILLALNATGYAAYGDGSIDGVALSFAVMVHAVNLFVHAATGAIGFVQEGITLQQLSYGVKRIQHVDAS
jgi:uncharacterized protein (TIRG00374 family)